MGETSGKQLPIFERTECSVCRRPVDLMIQSRTKAFVEPLSRHPHVCPEEALTRWKVWLRVERWKNRKV
jgi:hypothetical protein